MARIFNILLLCITLVCGSIACTTTAAPTDALRLIGRFEQQGAQHHSTWPGSAFEFNFAGSQATIELASSARVRFIVDVNGKQSDLWVDGAAKTYTLAEKLPQGKHHIRVTRVTESFDIVSSIYSQPKVDGKLLPPPTTLNKKILAIGDSITAGYGIEGNSKECGYSMETSNQLATYAAIAARELNADIQAIAWSGIGAWRSYGENTPVNPTILDRYSRTLANNPTSQWPPQNFQPDVITIAIGTNDYWTGSVTNEYRLGMKKLVEKVRADYPGKPLYLIVSPMLGGEARQSQISEMQTLQTPSIRVVDLGKIEASDGYGCDYHPNSITNKRMGEELIRRIRKDLHW